MAALKSGSRRFRLLSTHFMDRRKLRSTLRLPFSSILHTASVRLSPRCELDGIRCFYKPNTPHSSRAILWCVKACLIARYMRSAGTACTAGCTCRVVYALRYLRIIGVL